MTHTLCSRGHKIPWYDRRYVVTQMEGSKQLEVREYCANCFWLAGKNRSPKSTRPIRTTEAMTERHSRILELWHENGRTPQEIAGLVGLKYTQSIYRHVDGKCRCLS